MERVLLSDGEPMHYGNAADDRLAVRSWRHEGRDWVLIVNRTRQPVKASLGLPGDFTLLDIAIGGGVSLNGRSVDVDFPGLGYAFLSLGQCESLSAAQVQRFAERMDSLLAIGTPDSRISAYVF